MPPRRRHVQLLAVLAAVAVVLYLYDLPQALLELMSQSQIRYAEPQPELENELRRSCRLLTRGTDAPPGLDGPAERDMMAWLCGRVGVLLPWPSSSGCGRQVTYLSSGGDQLEQLMLRYAVLFGYWRLFAAESVVEVDMREALRQVFPDISLPSVPPLDDGWEVVSFWRSRELLRCRPDRHHVKQRRRYRIAGPPDGSSVDLFHPFREELRQEFHFSVALQRRAEAVLSSARGARPSATFIGVHLAAGGGQRRPLKDSYISLSLDHYRRRFADALFLIGSPERSKWPPVGISGGDIVSVETTVLEDSALWLAVRAACNHSIVSGADGFWGAYLASGTVVTPRLDAADAAGYGWLPLDARVIGEDSRWVTVDYGDEHSSSR